MNRIVAVDGQCRMHAHIDHCVLGLQSLRVQEQCSHNAVRETYHYNAGSYIHLKTKTYHDVTHTSQLRATLRKHYNFSTFNHSITIIFRTKVGIHYNYEFVEQLYIRQTIIQIISGILASKNSL